MKPIQKIKKSGLPDRNRHRQKVDAHRVLVLSFNRGSEVATRALQDNLASRTGRVLGLVRGYIQALWTSPRS